MFHKHYSLALSKGGAGRQGPPCISVSCICTIIPRKKERKNGGTTKSKERRCYSSVDNERSPPPLSQRAATRPRARGLQSDQIGLLLTTNKQLFKDIKINSVFHTFWRELKILYRIASDLISWKMAILKHLLAFTIVVCLVKKDACSINITHGRYSACRHSASYKATCAAARERSSQEN